LRRLALIAVAVAVLLAWAIGTRLFQRPDRPAPPQEVRRAEEPPESSPVRLDAPSDHEGWWFQGTVESIRPRRVTIEAHWWPDRESVGKRPPERVFSTEPIDVGEGEAEFRVEGTGDGHVLLFSRTEDSLAPLWPFTARKPHAVMRGGGYGWQRPAVVGAITVRGRAVTADGRSVPDVVLSIREPGTQRAVRVTTGDDGEFEAYGFHAYDLEFTYREAGAPAGAAELAGFENRRQSAQAPFTLHMPRNPRIRIRGRIEGIGGDASYPPSSVHCARLDTKPPRWSPPRAYMNTDSLRLRPGRYRLGIEFVYAGSRSIETKTLELDEEIEIDVEVEPRGSCAILDVGLLPEPRTGEAFALAVEARDHRSKHPAFSGSRVAVSARRALVVNIPGTYSVRGAVKLGEEVWAAPATTVRLERGERRRITLKAARAASVLLERVPARLHGVLFLHLWWPEPLPAHSYLDEPFRIAELGHRTRDTRWWIRPGSYELRRTGQDDKVVQILPFQAESGKTVHVSETPKGLQLRDP
jgi:hypothetical protein